jgi:phosphatidylglycerol:prolipoprotein diacylglycerol transferase
VFPEIVRIGGESGLAIPTRLVLHLVAFGAWLWLVLRARPDLLADPRRLATMLLLGAGGGLVANLVVAALEGRSLAYAGNFLSWTLGALAGGAIWCRLWREPVAPLLDAVAPPTLLASAIGRVACFCEGCCHGVAATGFPAMHFPHATHGPGSYYPTQILEAALALVAFLVARRAAKRGTFAPGGVAALCGLLYAAYRFPIEWFRAEERVVLGLTRAQGISLFVAAVSLAVLLARTARPAPPTT